MTNKLLKKFKNGLRRAKKNENFKNCNSFPTEARRTYWGVDLCQALRVQKMIINYRPPFSIKNTVDKISL